jgi:hyperosmotically inducible periplasmic protein
MRAFLRAFLVIALLLVVGFVAFGYWTGASSPTATAPAAASGTSGTAATEKVRERGAELGEKAAVAAEEVGNAMGEAAITAKIKAKMALDDSVRARSVDVSTTGPTVTLTGTVRSAAEHDRTIALARETAGVRRVVDHLVMARD